jgi:hypothetical protein
VKVEINYLDGRLSEDMTRLGESVRTAARLAINYGAERKALPLMRTSIGAQVNFPKAYLQRPDVLGLKSRATNATLEARISARLRPTTLARFAVSGGVGVKSDGVDVAVKPGRTVKAKRTFLIRLRSGSSGELGNTGLAIRLANGENIKGKKVMVKPMNKGESGKSRLYLLYGPSVQQIGESAAIDSLPEIGEAIAIEYDRQLARIL